MMKDIVIIGTVSFGKEVAALLEDNNRQKEEWNILGFVDDYLEVGSEFFGYPVLGTVDWLLNYPEPIFAVIGIGSLAFREKMMQRLDAATHKLSFPPLISRYATIISEKTTTIGEGTVIAQGATIAVDVEIGRFSLINHHVVVGHDSNVGNCVNINPNSTLSGCCVIKDGVDIGAGVTIIPKKTVGHHAVLGAGTVVIGDIPDGVTAYGVPSQIKGEITNMNKNYPPPP